ncbi:cobalt ECF transporter T component CbiQ [Sporosalibacterium faouarense]|uniref:cobalt ECF transporter T component CbiQ n=1 Tax=Sporosalibacterium faouarense TaxID=516123 RepID=UPI00141C8A57|nr:cobalt ECF transporter T component CbiQ [Sporosalibacterium faouarense]MTI47103.1 cobalt ECF transporter T component CbiQ [Bacillota bacterium]
MSTLKNSLYHLRLLDDLGKHNSFIHKVHPLIKLITTVFYLAVVISFERYDVSGLLPLIFYPMFIFLLGELPITPILKRLLIVAPLIIGIGIMNPLFDNSKVLIGNIYISRGWITFLSILIKCGLTVTASILLVATTGINRIAEALRMLKVPKIFVLQLLLTYRYFSVLIEEVSIMIRAYSLRAPGQKGIHRSVWGSFTGILIIRTFDRAQRVYQSMNLRGFRGEYINGYNSKITFKDFLYLMMWCFFFTIVRIYNIPLIIDRIFTGVIN